MATLAAFVNADETIRVHHAGCSYVVRERRNTGNPVIAVAESEEGMRNAVRKAGIRYTELRFMKCCGVPDGFWSHTPNGDNLRLLPTRVGARNATARIRREARKELDSAINGLSEYARQIIEN